MANYYVLRDTATDLFEIVEASDRTALMLDHLSGTTKLFATPQAFKDELTARRWLSAGGLETNLISRASAEHLKAMNKPGIIDLAMGQKSYHRINAEEEFAALKPKREPPKFAEADTTKGKMEDKYAERDRLNVRKLLGDQFSDSNLTAADQPRRIDLPADEVRSIFDEAEKFVDTATTEMSKRTLDMMPDDVRTPPAPTQTDLDFSNDTNKSVFRQSVDPVEHSLKGLPRGNSSEASFARRVTPLQQAPISVDGWTPGADEDWYSRSQRKAHEVLKELPNGEYGLSHIRYQGRSFLSYESLNAFRAVEQDMPKNDEKRIPRQGVEVEFRVPDVSHAKSTGGHIGPAMAGEGYQSKDHPLAATVRAGNIARTKNPDSRVGLPLTADDVNLFNARQGADQRHVLEHARLTEVDARRDSRTGFERSPATSGFGPESTWDLNPHRENSLDYTAENHRVKEGWGYRSEDPFVSPWENQQRTDIAENFLDPARYGGSVDPHTGHVSAGVVPEHLADSTSSRPSMHSSEVHFQTHSYEEASLIARQRAGKIHSDTSIKPVTFYELTVMAHKRPVSEMTAELAYDTLTPAQRRDAAVRGLSPQEAGREAAVRNRPDGYHDQFHNPEVAVDKAFKAMGGRVDTFMTSDLNRFYVDPHMEDRPNGHRVTYESDLTASPVGRDVHEGNAFTKQKYQSMKITSADGTVTEGNFIWSGGKWVKVDRPHIGDGASNLAPSHKTAYVRNDTDGNVVIRTYDYDEAERIKGAISKQNPNVDIVSSTGTSKELHDVRYFDKEYDFSGKGPAQKASAPEMGVYLTQEHLGDFPVREKNLGRSALPNPTQEPVSALGTMLNRVQKATERTSAAVSTGASVSVSHTVMAGPAGANTPGYVVSSRFTASEGGASFKLGRQDAFAPLHGVAPLANLSSDPYHETQQHNDPFVADPNDRTPRPLAGGVSRTRAVVDATGAVDNTGPAIAIGRGTLQVTVGDKVVYDNGFAPGPGDFTDRTAPRDSLVEIDEIGPDGKKRRLKPAQAQAAAAAHLQARLATQDSAPHSFGRLERGAQTVLGSVPGSSLLTSHLGRAAFGYAAGSALSGVLGFSTPGLNNKEKMAAGAEGAMWGVLGMNHRATAYGLKSHLSQASRDEINAAMVSTAVGFGIGTPVGLAAERYAGRRSGPATGQVLGFAAGAAVWMAASFVGAVFVAMRARAAAQAQNVTPAMLGGMADQARMFGESASDGFDGLDIEFVDEEGTPLEADFDADERDVVGVEDEDGEDVAYETMMS